MFYNKHIIKLLLCITSLLAVMAGSFVTAKGADGVYTIGRTTSYINPETGATYDGGANIALGDSMCASIVESNLLIEVYNGKTYVTMGLGMVSNISNIRISVQSAPSGDYQSVAYKQTGSITKDGDGCSQLRFEVPSLDVLIRPTFYVNPMGRDVTFYVKLNTDSIQSGKGDYVSEFFDYSDSSSDNTSVQGPNDITIIDTVTGSDTASQIDMNQNTQLSEQVDQTSIVEVSSEIEDMTQGEEQDVKINSPSVTKQLENATGLKVHKVTTDEMQAEQNNTIQIIITLLIVVLTVIAGILIIIRRKKVLEAEKHDKK